MRIRVNTDSLRQRATQIAQLAAEFDQLGKNLQQAIYPINDYGGQLPNKKTAFLVQYDAQSIRDELTAEAERLRRLAWAFDEVDVRHVVFDMLLKRKMENLPPPPWAPPEPPNSVSDYEALYGKYHQYQGKGTAYCGDFSLSMACNVYYGSRGESTDRCAVGSIRQFLDGFLGGRFPYLGNESPPPPGDGGATPYGIDGALKMLGIPYRFNLSGSQVELERALENGKIVIVSEGKLFDPQDGTWGHVMVLVGKDSDNFIFLDPGSVSKAGAPKLRQIPKQKFLDDWWYEPFHPCWTIG